MITISNQTAGRTRMNTVTERLADFCSAQTGLRCATRVNFHEQPTSILRFVGQHKQKSRPSGVADRLCQRAARKPLYVQIFDRNQPVLIDNPARLLVMEIPASIADVVMKSLQEQDRLTPSIRAALSSRYTSLQAPEFTLSTLEPARVTDHGSIAQGCEARQANVHAYDMRTKGHRTGSVLDNKERKPSPSFASDRKRLNRSSERAVQLYPDVPNLWQPHSIASQRLGDLSVRNAVVAPDGSESRITAPLLILHTSEECLKRQMDTLQGILKNDRTYGFHVMTGSADILQLQVLIKPRNRLSLPPPCFTPFLDSCVVKFTAHSKMIVKDLFLSFRGIDAVAKGLYQYRTILSLNLTGETEMNEKEMPARIWIDEALGMVGYINEPPPPESDFRYEYVPADLLATARKEAFKDAFLILCADCAEGNKPVYDGKAQWYYHGEGRAKVGCSASKLRRAAALERAATEHGEE